MAEGNRTCRLLTQITSFPISLEDPTAIFEQRRAENEAHERYQSARTKLFEAANWS
jgi:hypothetical protein